MFSKLELLEAKLGEGVKLRPFKYPSLEPSEVDFLRMPDLGAPSTINKKKYRFQLYVAVINV